MRLVKLNIAAIKEGSLVDGEGVRLTIFFAGCRFKCPGCQNKQYQNPKMGILSESSDLLRIIKINLPMIDGITLSGGDPMFNPEDTLRFLEEVRREFPTLNIWIYTGEYFKNIPEDIKSFVDVIVDGPYVKARTAAEYRGSSNQKIYTKNNGVWKHD